VALTLDQALKKGVEAHKAGKAQEADQYYTAVLKANPKHPDANHNMGVLAVGVGKVNEGLPFFKTALEANANIAQFWLSYIDALVKLDRIADAKAVFEQAKSKGLKGEGFDQIEERLGSSISKDSNPQEPPGDQFQSIVNLYTQGQYQEVLTQALRLQKQFPKAVNLYNIIGAANKGLGKLDEAMEAYDKALSIKPDYAEVLYNVGIALEENGKLDEAIEAYNKALASKPDFAEAYNNIGNALNEQGKPDEAIEAYNKALASKPDFAEAYNNVGNALNEQGKLEEAIQALTKALDIQPDFAEAYNNMGNALNEQGKLVEAIQALTKALSIKPDYAEAYYNMGVVIKEQGKLDEAIKAYSKAISLKPNYAEAYNNMGNAFLGQGNLEQAIDAYKKAISIKSDFANAYWNLYGTAGNISEAKKWIEQCLKADPNYLNAELTLSALQFYEGEKSNFNALLKSSLKDDPYIRSFAWVFNLPNLPPLHFNRWALFVHMTDLSKKDRPFYEFGVWRGEAFRYLIKTFKKGYGFDTFEGLPEDWHNEKAGTYTSDGNIPKIKGGKFIVGKFEETLPGFFAEERPMASIINFDADLYSSTICALNFAKPVIDQDTILIFDEFIMNKNWEQDEYKALEEFCANNDYSYEVLAISFFTKQVAVKLIGI
tara:strand:+ start:216 stop:2189 length:1974 start_codon:yes stop_codon:yes gene_type:complete